MSRAFFASLQKSLKYFCLSTCITLSMQVAHAENETAGHYQAILGDCIACHSAPNRPTYSGGLPFHLPIGTIYSTNITPDPIHGIGNYTEAEFSRAVREGIRKDGASLYPAMPFPSYAHMSDADIHQLYLYFHDHVQAVALPSPKNEIIWPLSMRWPLSFWRWLYAPNIQKAQETTQHEYSDPIIARGAYLVEGAGHCGACHTPRTLFMNEKALTASEGNAYLSGGAAVDGWVAPSLRQENQTGLGRWTEQDIVDFLKDGRSSKGTAFGGMTEVVTHSSYGFTDADLHAVARYLLTLQPAQEEKPWHEELQTQKALQKGNASARGAQIYVDRCAACHRTDGHGYGTVFPPLAGNPVILTKDPTSLIHIIQAGGYMGITPTAPSSFAMPAFVHMLSDREIADVASFIRQAWGNHAPIVSESQVSELKKTMPPITKPDEQPKN